MIERLSSDKLADQSVSPTPPTPEQSDSEQQGSGRPSSSEPPNLSPREMRRRSQTQGQMERGSGGSKCGHKPLSASKSTDYTDGEMQYSHRASRDRRGDHQLAHLRPPASAVNSSSSSFGSDSARFSRTHSGSSTNSGQSSSHGSSTSPTSGLGSYHRSLSPPGSSSYDPYGRARGTISPPAPTSKPPPLPSNAKKQHNSGPRSMQQPQSRWSVPSTDSASSEDSLTADIPSHPKSHHRYHGGEYSRSNVEQAQGYSRDQTGRPHHHQQQQQNHQQQQQHPAQLPSNSGANTSSDYHRSLDNVVKDAYRSSPSNQSSAGGGSKGNAAVLSDHQQLSRKSSWQGQHQGGRAVDCSTTSHPLQTSVSRGQHLT